jgi:hypothetical protein
VTGGSAAAPWQRTRIDPEIVLAEVRRLLPGITAWAGEYTGSYWALLDNELHEFKEPHALIACVRARLAPPPRQGAPSPRVMGDHRPRHARPAREPVLFDFPEGRWRRLWGAVRRVLAGEREMAW